MSAQLAGLALGAIALLLLVSAAILVLAKALATRRTLGRLTGSPSARAVAGIASSGRRIAAAASQLQALGGRIDALSERLSDAAVSGTRLALDVRAVAVAVEDLLETFVPASRGWASED